MASKDYAAIAASKIRKPSQTKRMPRIFIYGRYKKGKTRLSTTAPNVLVVDPEAGTDHETKANPDVWPINDWSETNDIYHYLKGKHPYKWVSLDGMTGIAEHALRFIRSQEAERNLERKPSDVKIQDYGKAGKLVRDLMFNLHSLHNVGFIFTAQERIVEVPEAGDAVGDDEATPVQYVYVPDLPNMSRGAVSEIVDVIGRLYTVRGEFTKEYRVRGTDRTVTKVDTIQRRLWVAPHPSYDTGYRSQFVLPDMIPDPTIPKLLRFMKEGPNASD
jgi:hypothetical protein